jgi:hypothetical protein
MNKQCGSQDIDDVEILANCDNSHLKARPEIWHEITIFSGYFGFISITFSPLDAPSIIKICHFKVKLWQNINFWSTF